MFNSQLLNYRRVFAASDAPGALITDLSLAALFWRICRRWWKSSWDPGTSQSSFQLCVHSVHLRRESVTKTPSPFPSKNWRISTYSIQKPSLVGDQSNEGFAQCHQQLQLKGIVFPLLGLCNHYIILAELNWFTHLKITSYSHLRMIPHIQTIIPSNSVTTASVMIKIYQIIQLLTVSYNWLVGLT